MEDEKNDEIKFVEFDGDIIEKLVQKEKGEQKIIRYQKGNCISKSKFSKCYKCLCLNTKEIFIFIFWFLIIEYKRCDMFN